MFIYVGTLIVFLVLIIQNNIKKPWILTEIIIKIKKTSAKLLKHKYW